MPSPCGLLGKSLNPCLFCRKVAIVLEELGLEYHPIYLDFQKGENKAPEHAQYNPNGRIPSLIDHKNNDFAIWCARPFLCRGARG